MSALQEAWQRVGFEDPAAVDRLLVRGAVIGAIVGVAALALNDGGARTPSSSPGTLIVTAALLVLVLPTQRMWVRCAVLAVSTLPSQFVHGTAFWSAPYFFTLPLGLMLAMQPLPAARRALLAVGPSLGAAWCFWLERWLSSRHLGPAVALGWLPLLAAGLFISAGAALGWLSFAADAMEPRLASQPRVMHAWRRVRTALGRLPAREPRSELEALTHEAATRWLGVRAERDLVASSLDETAALEAREAVTALSERLAETTDAELAFHLEQLRRVHRDTLEQLDGLRRKVERLDARAAAEAGFLETAAFSVELTPRTELGARELASRLRSLSSRSAPHSDPPPRGGAGAART